MDRSLSSSYVVRRRFRNWAIGIFAIALLALGLWGLRRVLGSSIQAGQIQTAVADVGPVENTLNASGEVIPASEQLLTSPIRANIQRVLLRTGAQVRPGEVIIELDKSLMEIDAARLKDQLALKRNGIEKLRLQLNKDLFDAEINNEIKTLNISRLQAELEDTRRLYRVGGRTQEDVTRAENALKIAELEKKQLENNLRYSKQSMGASLKESEIQAQMEEKNLAELNHKLNMAHVVADRPGVLTWVQEQTGMVVSEGEVLAKLADLRSFRAVGTASDAYSGRLLAGQRVILRLNDDTLQGVITQILPSIEDGVIRFNIQLDQPQHPALRPNQKTDLFIVTNRVETCVRLPNGPVFSGRRNASVFVIGADGKAYRRTVETGVSNFDYIEIKQGIQPGERVIISDLSRFEHLQQITVK
ncbi:MAG: HlyD family efflux transporter periplasmic adaptor subunit [Haliscomenobacter sp.]|nr:HlyD family efflux transporter periplasmic adaptor subunit [Haliscomenobacter sp.]